MGEWRGVAPEKAVWWHQRIRKKRLSQHFPRIFFCLRNLGECEKAAAQHSWRGVASLKGLSNRIPSEGAIPRRLMSVARKQERLPPCWPRDCAAQASPGARNVLWNRVWGRAAYRPPRLTRSHCSLFRGLLQVWSAPYTGTTGEFLLAMTVGPCPPACHQP